MSNIADFVASAVIFDDFIEFDDSMISIIFNNFLH